MITIDGQNIKTTWTLTPVMDGIYNELMKFPSLKERDTQDWSDKNGIQVLLSDPVYAHREMFFNFFCDTYAMYKEFIAYLKTHQTVTISDTYTDKSYKIEYLSCSDFDYYRSYNIFAIKVRECDPTDRIELANELLSSEDGYLIQTEDGINFIDMQYYGNY